MKVLDLFSGIGGFSLGLEKAGMQTTAFCEIDPYCRKVLQKHWPEVPVYEDVRELTAYTLRRDGIAVDVICGGFPCQDISSAGQKIGIDGERSGLWTEYARLIGEIRPQFVIVENVAALLNRGMDKVLGDLATVGYDAVWHCIPASAVGAPHRRDRIWIIAHPNGPRRAGGGKRRPMEKNEDNSRGICGKLADINGKELPYGRQARQPKSKSQAIGQVAQPKPERCCSTWWAIEPDVGRVAHGVSKRVDRLRALGNAVVPQITEMIGHAIMKQENH